MKIEKAEITREDIIEHWRQGKSDLDWRRMTTMKEKQKWLQACLSWSGLPTEKIRSFDYRIDGTAVQSDLDFYCLLGEVFFGYGGYFGQDSHGFDDCFTEISIHVKNNELVEKGAKVIIRNSAQIRLSLEFTFEKVVEIFRNRGFEVEIE